MEVLILDDHAMFRDGITHVLNTKYQMLVRSADTVEAGMNVISREHVDVAVVDYDLGDQSGLDFIRAARLGGFTNPILLVTAGLLNRIALQMVDGMICGILPKSASITTLAESICSAAVGHECATQYRPAAVCGSEAKIELTETESQALRLVSRGLSNSLIAESINLSESAVKYTLQRLFRKTGTRTRAQLTRIALEKSWTCADEVRGNGSGRVSIPGARCSQQTQ